MWQEVKKLLTENLKFLWNFLATNLVGNEGDEWVWGVGLVWGGNPSWGGFPEVLEFPACPSSSWFLVVFGDFWCLGAGTGSCPPWGKVLWSCCVFCHFSKALLLILFSSSLPRVLWGFWLLHLSVPVFHLQLSVSSHRAEQGDALWERGSSKWGLRIPKKTTEEVVLKAHSIH